MRKLTMLFSFVVCAVLFFSGVVKTEDLGVAYSVIQEDEGTKGDTYEEEQAVAVQDDSSQGSARITTMKKMPKKDMYKEKSFIGSKKWKGDGAIIGDKDKKMGLTAGDIVYTNLGSYEVKEGSSCDIFRRMEKVKNPKTGKAIGYEIRHLGTVEIIGNVGLDSSVAKIVNSRDTIYIGDQLKITEK